MPRETFVALVQGDLSRCGSHQQMVFRLERELLPRSPGLPGRQGAARKEAEDAPEDRVRQRKRPRGESGTLEGSTVGSDDTEAVAGPRGE